MSPWLLASAEVGVLPPITVLYYWRDPMSSQYERVY
jgi:hypothetical protein